jgi:hypothetical protein
MLRLSSPGIPLKHILVSIHAHSYTPEIPDLFFDLLSRDYSFIFHIFYISSHLVESNISTNLSTPTCHSNSNNWPHCTLLALFPSHYPPHNPQHDPSAMDEPWRQPKKLQDRPSHIEQQHRNGVDAKYLLNRLIIIEWP